jgi:EAL domain-containing protein (putative c-di-GMP-specific phosphodiesterase class I)
MKDYQKAIIYMKHLREAGFSIALDDFGTGYSSLKYLKEFPLSVIKVDKSFVDDIGINKNNEALIETILRMAQSLNMYCVAEGIETEEQVAFFKEHDCQFLQGFYFSKPVALADTFALIDKPLVY